MIDVGAFLHALWHTLTRWDAELKAKHAQIAATAVAAPVVAQPVTTPAVVRGAARPAYAGAGGLR